MRRFLLLALFLFLPFPAFAQEGMPAPAEHATAPEPDSGPSVVVSETVVEPEATPVAEPTNPQPIGPPHPAPDNVVDAFETGSFMVEAAKNGWWGIFTGLLIMILIFIADKLVKIKERVGKKAVPWVAAGLGILAAIAAQLTTGVHWGQALLQGFTGGISAVGLWELIFQHLLKKKETSEAEG